MVLKCWCSAVLLAQLVMYHIIQKVILYTPASELAGENIGFICLFIKALSIDATDKLNRTSFYFSTVEYKYLQTTLYLCIQR